LIGIIGIILGKSVPPNTYALSCAWLRNRATLLAVADLDRSHPAVLTLAGLAGVDPRTALSWLSGRPVLPAHERVLLEALPRARAALPEHGAAYAARVDG
jgi:hypothetical protein